MQTNETHESFNLFLQSENKELEWIYFENALLFGGKFIVIDKKHSTRTKKLFKAKKLPCIDTACLYTQNWANVDKKEILRQKKFLEGYH